MVYALVDIGNSAIKAHIYKDDQLISATTIGKDMASLSIFFTAHHIQRYVVSSVVPSLNNTIKEIADDRVLFLEHRHFDSINIDVDPVESVGIDRLVNAVAVQHIWNATALIIDVGTAVTFCRVKKKGRYLGGVIAPGFQMMQDALHRGAEQLPLVDFPWEPPALIGQTTESAMMSGLFYGGIAMINGIQKEFKRKDQKIATILTGGVPEYLITHINHDVYQRDLQFDGLKIMHQKCGMASDFK